MKNSKEKKQGKIISFLSILCLALAATSIYFALEGNNLRNRERLIKEKAVSSLCECLDSISVSLKKSAYSSDKKALSRVGNELCRQAAAAKESLSLLSADNELSDEVYKFLSQVGNFTLAVAEGEEEISKKEAEKLLELYSYAEKLSDGMNEICFDYYNGDLSFGDVTGNVEIENKASDSDFYKRVSDAAQTLTDYPTLVYDGPFADNLADGKGSFLKNKGEITAKEAALRVEEFLGVRANSLKREEDIESEIELYCFSRGGADITVTKKGGYICTLLSDVYAYEEAISIDEAIKRGEQYLEKLGYGGMKSSYYSIYDGICTVNYAYEQEGVIYYGDLVKLSISHDTGKLIALDAKPFLLSHRQRSFDKIKLSAKEAQTRISPLLKVMESRLACIPLDTGKEALCYELHCRNEEGQEFLVYLDAYTGQERDILILLYSDGGVLTK